jgi:hypothetical protein
MNDLTRVEWKELQAALLSVPARHRTKVWKKAYQFIERVIAGKNALAVPVEQDSIHYVPECQICHKAISILDDFVFHAASATYRHYDCFYSSTSGLADAC